MICVLENGDHYCEDCFDDLQHDDPLRFGADLGLFLHKRLPDGICGYCGAVYYQCELIDYSR